MDLLLMSPGEWRTMPISLMTISPRSCKEMYWRICLALFSEIQIIFGQENFIAMLSADFSATSALIAENYMGINCLNIFVSAFPHTS